MRRRRVVPSRAPASSRPTGSTLVMARLGVAVLLGSIVGLAVGESWRWTLVGAIAGAVMELVWSVIVPEKP
jgi:uncharacterized membrane protein